MGEVLKFEIKRISVIAYCEACCATRITNLREHEYEAYLKGAKKICPYCKNPTEHFCRRS